MGGSQLRDHESLSLREPTKAPWGLPDLLELLRRGARRVRARYPGSVLLVGDLSREHGGPIAGHRSHESGRDADVGFYFIDRRGKVRSLSRFVAVNADGRVVGEPELVFDDRRNWALVQAFLTDPRVRVQHIFVSAPLRARLLAQARRQGVYLPVLHRAALALKQPTRGLSHDDHFHVRIACPAGQGKLCIAEPPARVNRRHRIASTRHHRRSPGRAPASRLALRERRNRSPRL